MRPSAHFIRSVSANVAYWRERTTDLDSDAIREVDRDRHNLYRAADFGLALEETWRDSADLVLQSYPLINERGYYRDWIVLHERILECCREEDLILKGRVLSQLGIWHRRRRNLDKALEIHLEEEQIGELTGDRERTAFAHLHLAHVHFRLHQYDRGAKLAQAALETFRETAPGSEMVAFSLNASGLIAWSQGHLEEAESWLAEAANLFRRLGLPLEMGRNLMNLGNVLERAGRYDDAVECYDEAQTQFIATGSKFDETRLYMSLGTLLYHQGKLEEAEKVFRQADSEHTRQWDTPYQLAQIKANLANVLLAQGKLAESEAYWRECIPEWREAGARLNLANSLGGLAETLVAKGEINQAIVFFDESLDILAEYPKDAWAKRVAEMFHQERDEALAIEKSGGRSVLSE